MTSNISCTFNDKYYKVDSNCVRKAIFGKAGTKADLTSAFIRQAPIIPGNPEKGNFLVSGNIKCPEDPMCKCVIEDFAVISSTKCYYDAQGKMVCGPEVSNMYNCTGCKQPFHWELTKK